MIVFKVIRWRNLLSTGNLFTEVNLIDSPSTLVVGENGAGKSTLLEAVSYALYGRPFRRINKPQLINSINQKNLMVELEFSIGNKEYIIRRGMRPGVFEIFQDGILINQDAAAKDYQDYLEKNILKLNHKSFSQIITLGSRSYVPFMQLPAQHRREVIEDLLDLQIFSVMNTLLKQRVIDNKNDLKDVKYQADLIQEKIRLQKEYIKSINANNEKQIETNRQKIIEIDLEIIDHQNNIKDLQFEISNIALPHNNNIVTQIKELSILEAQFNEKNKKLQGEIHFYGENDECPTCKQGIDHSFKHKTIEQKNVQLAQVLKALENIKMKYVELQEKLDEITLVNDEIARLNNKITEYNNKIFSANDFKTKIEAEIKRLSQEHHDNKEDHEKLTALKNELKVYIAKHEQLIKHRSILDVVSILLKDGGIKSKIIKQYIPVINKLINKYLASMEFACSFELDENFNEIVRSRHRDEFSYDSFYEGEKARLDLAILFTWRAISKLRNANSSNLLILDETFDGSLDSGGTDELLKIIMSLASDSNIFVISHKQDSMVDKFSNIIRFEKFKNFSRIKENA